MKGTPLKRNLKLIAGIVALLGLAFELFELLYEPDTIVVESSSLYPDWFKFIRWSLTAGAVVVYFVVDNLPYKGKSSK